MDQLQQFIRTTKLYSYIFIVGANFLIIASWWIMREVLSLHPVIILSVLLALAILLPIAVITFLSRWFFQPITAIWQAILYLAPQTTNVPAPDLSKVHYGKEMAENLVRQVYHLADVGKHVASTTSNQPQDLHANFVAANLPLPLAILDKDGMVVFANKAMLEYLGKSSEEVERQNMYSVLDLSFTNDHTLDSWLQQSRESAVTASQTWEHVRLVLPGDQPQTRLFDLVAFYNKENTSGYETMLMLFDRSKEYAKEDQAVNYVALAVHELRTPLTMLRGYVEALEEELSGKIEPELQGFLQKTQVSANQLATFVNNILNIARINDDQMMFKLKKEAWQNVLADALTDLEVRAAVRGIKLTHDIAPDLPAVGVDRVSMFEVMSNLIDNAIKYSGPSKEIIVRAKLGQDGLVETTVQDFGVGIPASSIPQLFTKFYRDHHNRNHITGTGIGLYLCKTFVNAHGGNIWVRSHEGEGSTFGFTLVPYERIAEEAKNEDNAEIVRSAHGWIKNHSLYRR